ncbi:MAG: nucleotidyltransferase family protein [Verrucomicrobiota bacterium]|nr:nucleotidyltransferase family protein [Verrucomicrobiota bacterium]
MRTVAALILAAGGSSRFGRSKQLISYQGETLIARAVRIAGEARCTPVAVVLGGSSADVGRELHGSSVLIVQNDNWELGLGSSIRAGVLALLSSEPELEAIVLLACDQPRVEASTLVALIDQQQRSAKAIVASYYVDTLGIPALFTRSVFGELLALPDHSGAKGLIESRSHDVASVAFDDGAIDVDTPADLQRLLHDG